MAVVVREWQMWCVDRSGQVRSGQVIAIVVDEEKPEATATANESCGNILW